MVTTKQEWKIGDCLELFSEISNRSIDLIIADPPYNVKRAKWDNIPDYVNWMMLIIKECERVLKDTGSLYLFHSEIPTISKIQIEVENNTELIFKQFIVWNKRFSGSPKKGYLDGYVELNNLRNYQQMAEYILFYTFQDESGLTTVKHDLNNFVSLRNYFKEFQEALELSIGQINKLLGHRKAEHSFYWNSTQWELPTEETYNELCKLPLKYEFIRREYESLRQEYESLRQEYESLRQEYESLRYTFNNQKTHHSVWNYDIAIYNGHQTPKPTKLIENIILHSSNENDIVLDPFLGSGTSLEACKNTNRNCIGFEISSEWEEHYKKRLRLNEHKLTDFVGE